MNAEIGIKLEMGTRVLDFSRANPSDNPGQEAAVVKLGEAITRAKALVDQEGTGQLTVHASVLTKEELRDAITAAVRLLIGVARAASVEVPGVAARIKLRGGRTGHVRFLSQARVALVQATEFREVFTKYGMPEGIIEELTRLVQQFEKALDEKNAGFRSHVGANGELEVTVAEIMEIVHQLDAINRHRFRKQAELRTAWKSARDVHWPAGQNSEANGKARGGAEPAA